MADQAGPGGLRGLVDDHLHLHKADDDCPFADEEIPGNQLGWLSLPDRLMLYIGEGQLGCGWATAAEDVSPGCGCSRLAEAAGPRRRSRFEACPDLRGRGGVTF